MKVRIVIDSTADIRPELRERFAVVPLTIHFGDEEYVDGVDIDHRKFYEMLVERDVVPTTSQATPAAFEKAFALVFEKGTGIILKMGRQEKRQETYQTQTDAANICEDRENLKAFSKSANRTGFGNVAVSGAAGVGMGLFGVALPDIPFFTAMMLKSVYELAESYGFPCDTPAEQLYVLRVIEAALSCGEELQERSRVLDIYAQTGLWPEELDRERQIKATARQVSEAVLLGKALQNVPVAGAAGGVADAVYLNRIRKYAAIKYQKRFLIRRRVQ